MHVTVILCTFNRCHLLVQALESVASSEVPASVDWEVLVIDNNSNDDTHAVVEQFSSRHPSRFRYVFEPRPGKSFALNTGIARSTSEVLAFMDDDVKVDPNWLFGLTAPLLRGPWAGTGGRIFPLWTGQPPNWLPVNQPTGRAPLAAFDLGDVAQPMFEAPYGTNMAYRRSVFDKHGLFRTDLGPQPGNAIRSEDTEFGHRVLDGGGQLLYEPDAVVYHPVPEERLDPRYFLLWWFDKGRANVRESGLDQAPKFQIAGVPLVMLRRIAVWTVRWLLTLRSDRRFDCKLKVWTIAGHIFESRRRHAS